MPHHTVTSLSVTGGIHFPDLSLAFADALNTIIGARGTGKTGILHLIRFALGASIPAEYAEAFDSYIQDTLGAGRVSVGVCTQHGVSYVSSRCHGEAPRVTNSAGELVSVSLDGDLFSIEAYSAGQLELIACTPSSQLTLLDKFAGPEIRRIGDAMDAVVLRLKQNAAERDRIAAEIEADEAREAELPSVAEALKGLALEGAGDAGETARAQERKVQRGREARAMSELSRELAVTGTALDTFAKEALRRLAATVEGDLERAACGDVFRRAHQAVRQAAGAIETAAGRLRVDIASAQKIASTEASALAALHHKEDEAYQAIVVRQDADRERAAERERLHRRFDDLSALAKRMTERRRQHAATLADRRALLAERSAYLLERFVVRDRVAKQITSALNKKVKVTLVQGADHAEYIALLTDILHGSGTREDLILAVAGAIQPEELVAVALRNDVAAIEAVDPLKTGKPARAQRLLSALRATVRLPELEIAPVGDLPLIQLLTDKGYQDSNKVSTGQKCVCILSILLLESASPLLIDQVEDNLDNGYIYQVLVKTLEIVKSKRQLILVSHNPNIPVLGDSERVFALETQDGKGIVLAFGTVDEMREHIERILEGGREAFLRRADRYGHKPDGEKGRRS